MGQEYSRLQETSHKSEKACIKKVKKLQNLRNERQARSLERCLAVLGGGVRSVAFSSDDSKVVCGDGSNKVTVLEAASGAKLWEAALGGLVNSVAFSSDDSKVVCGDRSGKVTLLRPFDATLLTRLGSSPFLLDAAGLDAYISATPPLTLACGTSYDGCAFATTLAKRSRFDLVPTFLSWLEARPAGERAAAAAATLLCDADGANALDLALRAHKAQAVQALLSFLLANTTDNVAELLCDGEGGVSPLHTAVKSYPQALVAALKGVPHALGAYLHSEAPTLLRYDAARLDADAGGGLRIAVAGAAFAMPTKGFWPEGREDNAVDVVCGANPLPGLTVADSPLFRAIVESDVLPLIASEPMRAAIAFKWKAYGQPRWLRQVVEYTVFALTLLGGSGLLLTDDDAIVGGPRVLGAALFAVGYLLNLRYCAEEWRELGGAGGVAKYLLSMTNLIDLAVASLVLVDGPLLAVGSAEAAPVTAVAALLIFLKGQKVMRGNEDFSFLIDMLLNIVLDMRSFLAILGAAIVVNAFAYRLLRSDTDAYGNTGAAVLSSYALLMHADGVGDHDIYMSGVLAPSLLYGMTLLVDIVMLNALIAIMGDTYDRVSDTRLARGLQLRARLLLDIEGGMKPSEKTNENFFPRWLHVIRLKEEDEGEAGWSGRLNEMAKKIEATKKTMSAKIDGVESKIDGVESKIESKIGAVESKIGAVESKIGAVESKIGAVESKIGAVESKILVEMGKITAALEVLAQQNQLVASDVSLIE